MVVVVANGDEVEVADGSSIADLLVHLGLAGRLIVVERNGDPVPRKQLASTALHDGDRLELVKAVAGG